ncbi:hypothetical protein Poli38472_013290 [Pythium oligandrum]|uniref:ubiquitinyl hydrolase 1 n=1 Tax=Pythium oligandrum TaxID=41045 RepID=A0A8K1C2U9_PYTOL|nr:hypothetical protein Poli38472_013290 [Pythium oligandrum]|eukprot:TMW55399.1 hypothetical protein Poli38472_013290 [Pythium oligandrum]
MLYEYIGGLEVTYGNALAGGGGFHRVTTTAGSAAEVTPATYLWYKLTSNLSVETPSTPTASGQQKSKGREKEKKREAIPTAIVQLHVAGEAEDTAGGFPHVPNARNGSWCRMEKALDRQKGLFLWYYLAEWRGPESSSPTNSASSAANDGSAADIAPLKEIRVVRDLKDLPEGFEHVPIPLVSDTVDKNGNVQELRSFISFQRLDAEDLSGSRWSILKQKAGNWVDIRDLGSNRWYIGQLIHISATECRIQVSTWRKSREEVVSLTTSRNRLAKLGSYTNIQLSPAYPFCRKQGSPWNFGMKDLDAARQDFDRIFYDASQQAEYIQQALLPLVEKSLLSMYFSNELAEEVNHFHCHVLKAVVAWFLTRDSHDDNDDATVQSLLAIIRIILNGIGSCMFFYLKYGGSYSTVKSQRLVYTSYVTSPDVLSSIPSRHPGRSFYFVDNLDLFLQAGGFSLILQRVGLRDVALVEIGLFIMILQNAKPCLMITPRRKRSTSSDRRKVASTPASQMDDFFRDFLNAVLARLRRMSMEELKDEDGIMDYILGGLEMLYRDETLLGGEDAVEVGSSSVDGATEVLDVTFSEAYEVFHLDLAKKHVCCPYLAQRLLGITRLSDLITRAQRKETLQKKSSFTLKRTGSISNGLMNAVYGTSDAEPPATKWLRPRYLAEWLMASDVLEVILGDDETCHKYGLREGVHLELLKRSRSLLEYVNQSGLLTEKHITLLWRAGMNQLRSGKKTIFEVLLTLSRELSADLLDIVMVLATQVQDEDYDDLLVTFIQRIIAIASKSSLEADTGAKKSLTSFASVNPLRSRRASGTSKDAEVYSKIVGIGLSLLWNGIESWESTEGNKSSLLTHIESSFADSVNQVNRVWAGSSSSSSLAKEQQQHLHHYLSLCIESIKSGNAIERSALMVQKIVNGFGTRSGNGGSMTMSTLALARSTFQSGSTTTTTPSELLKELNSRYQLVSIVVSEVTQYMDQSRERGSSVPSIPSSNTAERFLPSAHQLAMEKRLNFLGYLVTSSDLELSYKDIERLWKCFTGELSSVEERDVFYDWLSKVLPSTEDFTQRVHADKSAFSLSTIDAIFNDLTSGSSTKSIRLDIREMTRSSFWAFERLFRCVNVAQRSLRCENGGAVKGAASILVESMDLKGVEALYDIALKAPDEGVGTDAINYIIHLHLNLGSKIVGREVWSTFMSWCLSRLQKSVHSSSTDGQEVYRLLVMMNTFLYQGSQASRNGSTADSREELTVYIRTQDGRTAPPLQYRLRKTVLVGELRDMIGRDSGYPPARVRIITEHKIKLTAQGHDRSTLEKANIFRATSSATKMRAISPVINKRPFQVEAILLAKPESDTIGHVERAVTMSANGCNEDHWDVMKAEVSKQRDSLILLQDLLSYREGICEEAWKLLKMLDYDSEMEKQTRSLNGAVEIDGSIQDKSALNDWNHLLDSASPPKLLYQLELVEKYAMYDYLTPPSPNESLVKKERSESSTGVKHNAWSASFSKLGGRKHLENFVLSINPRQVVAQGPLWMMSVSRVFKLLRHLAPIVQHHDEPSDGVGNLVHQLLEIIKCVQTLEEAEIELGLSTGSRISVVLQAKETIPDGPPVYSRPALRDLDNREDNPTEAHLVVRALQLMTEYVSVTRMEDVNQLLFDNIQRSAEVLLKCLISSRVDAVRKEAVESITGLCNHNNGALASCRRLFLTLIGEFDGPVTEPEYYRTYAKLLARSDGEIPWFNFAPASIKLCRRIKIYVPSEQRTTPDKSRSDLAPVSSGQDKGKSSQSDSLLEALLYTLLVLLRKIPREPPNALDTTNQGGSLRQSLLGTLHQDEEIIQEIYSECLFTGGEEGNDPSERSAQYYLKQPKCRSDSCRKVAFELLKELVGDNADGLRYLLLQMGKSHSLIPPPEVPGRNANAAIVTSKKKRTKSKETLQHATLERAKYVGLKNLGCTCYMNSTIQAFFMMPRVRRQILRYPSVENGVLYQLQSVFAHLEGSAKPYFNPKALTAAMKTWEGEPIDVNVQQDASEFLTSFFQQLESEMNGGMATTDGHHDDNILNAHFGGIFSNELIAEGDRYSESFEPFHVISVPVRDRKNLKESLDSWVEGERVSYTWESPRKEDSEEPPAKVTLDTHKRISIQKLPNQLIVHLKRFEFDYEAMHQTKLHDRFEFPMELDMFEYTKEGQEEARRRRSRSTSGLDDEQNDSSTNSDRSRAPEYYQYELVGTVVHMGTAHSGHYYSFLREQEGEADAEPRWYEFNDTMVTPFDPDQIPVECFGGVDDELKRRGSTGSASNSRKKNRSSFMLIYARTQPKVEDVFVPSAGRPRKKFSDVALALLFVGRMRIRTSARLQQLRARASVIAPEPIRDLIMLENRIFWRKKYLFSPDCLDFTYELVRSRIVSQKDMSSSSAQSPPSRFEPVDVRFEALQLSTKFAFGTLWQNGDVPSVLKWKKILTILYAEERRGSEWLLAILKDNETLLLDLLVTSEHADVRQLMATLLTSAITMASREASVEEDTPSTSEESRSKQRRRSSQSLPLPFEFAFVLFRLMPSLLTVPARHHREYFTVVLDFAMSGHDECAFTVVNSVVGAVVGLLTGLANTQPLLQNELKRTKSRAILKSIDLDRNVLKLLSILLRRGPPPAVDVENAVIPPNLMKNHANLTSNDHEVLTSERFITLITQRASHYTKESKSLEQIVIHLCWESRRVTEMFMDKVMHGIEVEDHDDVKPYFRTLNTLFKIKDSLASERVNDGMTKLIAVMASQQRYYKATEVSIDMLIRLAKRQTSVVVWLQANRMSCTWIEKWLSGHRGNNGYLQQRRTSLVKPNSTSPWVSFDARTEGVARSVDRAITKLLPRIRSALDPESTIETFYDSDDNPNRLVGKRVRVKWAREKWYEGEVEKFDEDSYEHHIVYDDGDRRKYRMSDKIFYVVEAASSSEVATESK